MAWSPPPANWLQLAPPGNPDEVEQAAEPAPADSGIPVEPSAGPEGPVEPAQMVVAVSAGSEAPVGAVRTAPSVPADPETRAGTSKMPRRPVNTNSKPAAPKGSSQMAPPAVRTRSPAAPARTPSPAAKRPAYSRPRAGSLSEASPKETVQTNPTARGVVAQMTPSVTNRPASPAYAARLMPPPPPRRPVHPNPKISGMAAAAPMTPSMSNRPAAPTDATQSTPRTRPPAMLLPVSTNPSIPGLAAQITPSRSNRPAALTDASQSTPQTKPPAMWPPVSTNQSIPGVAAQMMPSMSNRPAAPTNATQSTPRTRPPAMLLPVSTNQMMPSMSNSPAAPTDATQSTPRTRPPAMLPPVSTNPSIPGVAAQITPSRSNRPAALTDAYQSTPRTQPPAMWPPVSTNQSIPGVAAQMMPSMSNRPAAPTDATQSTPRMRPPAMLPPVSTNPLIPGVAAQITPSRSNRPAAPTDAYQSTPRTQPPAMWPPVSTNQSIPGVAAQMTLSMPNRPAAPMDAAQSTPRTRPPAMWLPVSTNLSIPGVAAQMTPSNRLAVPMDYAELMQRWPAVLHNPSWVAEQMRLARSRSNRPAAPTDAAGLMPQMRPQAMSPAVSTNPSIPGVASQMTPSVSNRPVTPVDTAASPPRSPVCTTKSTIPAVAPSALTRPPRPAGTLTASPRSEGVRTASPRPAGTRTASPRPRVNPANSAGSTARAGETQNRAGTLRLLELDTSMENPDILRATREKNRANLSVLLDPRCDCTKMYSPTGDDVWYISSSACHHVSGNLDLLSNLSPVSDRWVRCAHSEEALQILARGSVNCNKIILDDVWYIPNFLNIVSTSQLARQGLHSCSSTDVWMFKHFDGSVAGQAHIGPKNIYELDFLNTSTSYVTDATWYLVSSAQEHMTGNLELLTNYRPVRPSRGVRTHTGAILQVCGKGSLENKKIFFVPGISYVPGFDKNIISITQLTDSGYIVSFGCNGCSIKRRNNMKVVGLASYGGEELFRLISLRLDVFPGLDEIAE